MSARNIVSAGARRSHGARRKQPRPAGDAQQGAAAPGGPTRSHGGQGNSSARRQSTREQLLETAGQIFSEKGFAGATGKEICERSGANAAAVVYHFGGMDNLYRAVVQEARNRLAPSEALAAAVAAETDPKAKLTAFIGLLARVLSGPVSSTWAARLMSREMIAPTAIFDEMRNKEMLARAAILRSIVCELTELPADNPAVARSCNNIMAPFGDLLLIGPQRLEKKLRLLSFAPESTEEFTRHLVQFALGGLAAIAHDARTAR